ncbi:hypothetical protein RRG08_024599 [Elysia crispata]|uniref:Uncharacterized protein n=1 Tax=Elysia crispata TaxID=231223 RepID=A0AAE1DNG6_9GAST|nr:hypothetical protein RRG08_024599 [Elysia crispata]
MFSSQFLKIFSKNELILGTPPTEDTEQARRSLQPPVDLVIEPCTVSVDLTKIRESHRLVVNSTQRPAAIFSLIFRFLALLHCTPSAAACTSWQIEVPFLVSIRECPAS